MDARTPSDKSGASGFFPYILTNDPPPIRYKASRSPGRLRLKSIGWAFLIALVVFAPLIALLAYIFLLNGSKFQGTVIETSAAYNVIVSITSVNAKIADLSLVPIMTLMATCVAAQWFRASDSNDLSGQPTPVQLGTAMSVLGGSNLRSVWEALKLVFGTGSARRHAEAFLPSKIRASVCLLAWLLLLHYGITVLDQVMHWTTHPHTVLVKARYSAADLAKMQYSLGFNETRCEAWQSDGRSTDNKETCGLAAFAKMSEEYIPIGSRTLTNSSSDYAVAWADDGSALMVPAKTANVSFIASTMGIRTQCASITKSCVRCPGPQDTTSDCVGGNDAFSSEARFNFGCPTLNTTQGNDSRNSLYIDGLVDPITNSSVSFNQYTDFFSRTAKKNPFRYAFVAESRAYDSLPGVKSSHGRLIGDTGFFRWSHQGPLNVVDCQVLAMDARYQFIPPASYKVLSSQPSTLRHAQYMSYFVPLGWVVTLAAQGNGANNETMSFPDAAALEVSKRTVAAAAVLYRKEPVIEIVGKPVRGSTVQLAVLAPFIGLVVLLAITALSVGLNAAISLRNVRSPLISVVRQRLLSPQGLLLDLYGRPSDNEDDLLSDKLYKAFAPSTDADRLAVGAALERGRWVVRARRSHEAPF